MKAMKWTVVFHPAFRSELKALPTPVYDKLLSFAKSNADVSTKG